MKPPPELKAFLLVVMGAALVAGCHSPSPQIGLLPRIPNGVEPAQIVVFRLPPSVGNFSLANNVSVDDKLIIKLFRGKYTILAVAPGRHKIAVATSRGRLFGMQTVELAEGARYVLQVNGNGLTAIPYSKFGTYENYLYLVESKNE